MNDSAKALALHRLRESLERAESEGTLVFGEGNPSAKLVIVGEAPGPEEELRGRPFVGQGGKFLDRLLAEAGIPRNEIWISNVVKRRPTSLRDGRVVTRAPTPSEIKAHLPWLERELAIIRPRVVLCLGAVPASALIHDKFRIEEEQSRWFTLPDGAHAMAIHHPAYLRRFGKSKLEPARAALRAVKAMLDEHASTSRAAPEIAAPDTRSDS